MASAVSLFSCSDDEPTTLEVSNSTLSFMENGGTNIFTIKSNTSWMISNVPSWVILSQVSGSGEKEIVVNVRENEVNTPREAIIQVLTTDGSELTKSITIKQAGAEISLTVDVTHIVFQSGVGVSHNVSIRCNSSWSISGLPSWLQASSISGNGNSTIQLTTKSENDSSRERQATFTITTVGVSTTITVTQEAGLAQCISTPTNITALYYGVAFDLKYSSDVSAVKILMISDYDFKHNTELSLLQLVEAEEAIIPDDQTIFTRGWSVSDYGSLFHLLTVSYDKKGNRGEIVDETFIAPDFLDDTKDAYCNFTDAGYSQEQFVFNVVKKGRCYTYDLIYGGDVSTKILNRLVMAFEMNYYRNNHKKNWLTESWGLTIELDYPNDHLFSCPLNANSYFGGIFAAVRGRFSNGTASSDLLMISADKYANSASANFAKDNEEIRRYQTTKDWIMIRP